MTLNLLSELYIYFTGLIGVVALFSYPYLRGRAMLTLPLYVLLTTGLSLVVKYYVPLSQNVRFSNLVIIPIEFIYFILLYHFLSPLGKTRKLTGIALAVYGAVFLTDALYLWKYFNYLYLPSYTVGALLLLLIVVLYLYRLLNSAKLIHFYKIPGFWISIGVLLFYIGSLPMHVFWNDLDNHRHPAFIPSRYIFFTLMQLMYACFTIAIICTRWEEKK